MKTLFVGASAILLCAGLSACADESAAEDAASAAVVQSVYDYFAAGDVESFVGVLHPEIVWNEADNFPYAENNPYLGPGAVLAGVIAPIAEDWDGFAATPESIIAEGDRVAVQGRYTGVSRTTGEAIDAQFVHVWTVDGGQLIAFQQYADTYQVRMAMTPDETP